MCSGCWVLEIPQDIMTVESQLKTLSMFSNGNCCFGRQNNYQQHCHELSSHVDKEVKHTKTNRKGRGKIEGRIRNSENQFTGSYCFNAYFVFEFEPKMQPVLIDYCQHLLCFSISQVHQETFGKSGCRRIVPGQYLAVDPKGRAIMIGKYNKKALMKIYYGIIFRLQITNWAVVFQNLQSMGCVLCQPHPIQRFEKLIQTSRHCT